MPQVGQQVEIRVAGLHLEADTGGRIAVMEQYAIAQDAMNQIDRGAIDRPGGAAYPYEPRQSGAERFLD